jgi:hypothetical protein
MYTGASLTSGYGMQYRENFVHHSMEIPGLHGRGGIYCESLSFRSGPLQFWPTRISTVLPAERPS